MVVLRVQRQLGMRLLRLRGRENPTRASLTEVVLALPVSRERDQLAGLLLKEDEVTRRELVNAATAIIFSI